MAAVQQICRRRSGRIPCHGLRTGQCIYERKSHSVTLEAARNSSGYFYFDFTKDSMTEQDFHVFNKINVLYTEDAFEYATILDYKGEETENLVLDLRELFVS